MTVVLALVGCDCVALAADGLAAGGDGELTTRTAAKKLAALHGRIAFGCAGSAGLRQRVTRNLEFHIKPEECGRDIAFLRPKLHRAVNEVQHQAFEERVGQSEPGAVAVLFAGVSDEGKPWVYEVTPTGADEEHYLAEAIGSGRGYAIAALLSTGHHEINQLSGALEISTQEADQIRLLAYRVVNDAIAMATRDIGQPISMYVADRNAAIEVSQHELLAIKHDIAGWQQQERELFGELGRRRGQPIRRPPERSPQGIDPPPE